jgi:hypothetical protein
MALVGNKSALKHGGAHLPEYRVWLDMKKRCLVPSAKDYATYGGRGITVCKAWLDFETFYKDMGPKPSPEHQIDRINNNGSYRPSNCRWVTRKENMLNRKNTVRIRIGGVTKTMKEWAEIYGINYQTAKSRRRKGLKGKAIFE